MPGVESQQIVGADREILNGLPTDQADAHIGLEKKRTRREIRRAREKREERIQLWGSGRNLVGVVCSADVLYITASFLGEGCVFLPIP